MAFNTKLNLSCAKFYQADGTPLTLSGDTAIASVGTLKYTTDQSPAFTCLSMANAGFVTGLTNTLSTDLSNLTSDVADIASDVADITTDLSNLNTEVDDLTTDVLTLSGLTSNSICTASNGLTKTNRDVTLGGPLSASLTCVGTSLAQCFMIGNGDNSFSSAYRGGKLYIGKSCIGGQDANNIAILGAKSEGTVHNSFMSASATAGLCMSSCYGGLLRTTLLGTNALVYGGDYSTCFTARSLVDKAYVTGQTSTINADIAGLDGRLDVIEPIYLTGATNGLTKVGGHDVKLGGNLSENTTITPVGATTITLGTLTNTLKVTTGCTAIQNQTGSIINGMSVNGINAQIISSDAVSGKFITQTFCQATPQVRTNVIDSSSYVTLEHGANSYSIRGCSLFPGLQYYADYKGNYTDRSLVDRGFVGTVSGQTLTSAQNFINSCVNACTITASNGLAKTGNDIKLGGALTQATTLTGSQVFGVNATTLNFTGATVNLGGSVAIKTTPTEGSGAILCRNASTGVIGLTSVTALGGLTGGTNGIHTVGQNVVLGGILTETTNLRGACLDISDVAGFNVRTSGNTDMNIDAQNCGGFLIKSQCGSINTFPDFTDAVGILGHVHEPNGFAIYDNRAGANQAGIVYAADYSANYVNRSLVDKLYVDTIATGLQVHNAAWVATTANINLASAPAAIDGVTLSNNDRVLVKDQTTGSENGVYVFNGAGVAMTRSDDFNFNPGNEITNGDLIPITSGLTENNSIWVLTTPNPVLSGETLTFTKFATVIDVQGGQGIDVEMTGGLHTVSVELASNCGMTFCGSGLAVNPSIAGNGLGYTNGVIDVCAPTGGVAASVAVKRDSGDVLVVNTSEINTALGGVLSGTTNGLSDATGVAELGGSLTKATTITLTSDNNSLTFTDTASTPRGIVYGSDYSASFDTNSLISKYYVDNIASEIDGRLDVVEAEYLSGATNGLSLAGNKQVKLGGVLTEDTEIELTTGYTFTIQGAQTAPFFEMSDNSALHGNGHHITINSMCETNILGAGTINIGNSSTDNLKMGFLSGIITDNNFAESRSGLTYAEDYKDSFVALSLVNKSYVDELVSASGVTASNGLNVVGTDVRLGGILTGDTNIDLNGNSFSITGGTNSLTLANGEVNVSGSTIYLRGAKSALLISDSSYGTVFVDNGETPNKGIQYFDDYSANFTERTLVDKAYVDSSSGAIGGDNGLTRKGDNIVLGGQLTGYTAINIDLFSLAITGTSTCNGLLVGTSSAEIGNYASGNVALYVNYGDVPEENTIDAYVTDAAGNGSELAMSSNSIYTSVHNEDSTKTSEFDTSFETISLKLDNNGDAAGLNITTVDSDEMITLCTSGGKGVEVSYDMVSLGDYANNNYISVQDESSEIYNTSADGNCYSSLEVSAGYVNTYVSDVDNTTSTCLQSNGFTITGNIGVFAGAKYAEDYSVNYTDRSIPDVEYVNGVVANVVVNNGLTNQNGTIVLGGPLTGDTTIGLAGNTLNYTGDSGAIINLIGPGNGSQSCQRFGQYGVSMRHDNIPSSKYSIIEQSGCGVEVRGNLGISLCTTGGGNEGRINIMTSTGFQSSVSDGTNTGLIDACVCGVNICSTYGVKNAGFTACGVTGHGIVKGTQGVCLCGGPTGTVEIEGSVKLNTTPASGTIADSVIVWNSTDKALKTVAGSSLGDKNNIYATTVVTGASITLTPSSSYLILVNYVNPSTITLPVSPTDGQAFKIKDARGNALSNNITVDGGANLIDGSATALINTDFGALELVYNQSLDGWFSLAFVN